MTLVPALLLRGVSMNEENPSWNSSSDCGLGCCMVDNSPGCGGKLPEYTLVLLS